MCWLSQRAVKECGPYQSNVSVKEVGIYRMLILLNRFGKTEKQNLAQTEGGWEERERELDYMNGFLIPTYKANSQS